MSLIIKVQSIITKVSVVKCIRSTFTKERERGGGGRGSGQAYQQIFISMLYLIFKIVA